MVGWTNCIVTANTFTLYSTTGNLYTDLVLDCDHLFWWFNLVFSLIIWWDVKMKDSIKLQIMHLSLIKLLGFSALWFMFELSSLSLIIWWDVKMKDSIKLQIMHLSLIKLLVL